METKGTITWHSIDTLPSIDESLQHPYPNIKYSSRVLVSDGVNISHSQYLHYIDIKMNDSNAKYRWLGYNNIPFEITHWAYINFPGN